MKKEKKFKPITEISQGSLAKYKTIPLTKGKFTIVDEEDYIRLSKFKWSFGGGYARRRVGTKKQKNIHLHREVLKLGDWNPQNEVDHKNMDTLDNRKCNLRVCSRLQNIANRKVDKDKHFIKYKGVCNSRKDLINKPFRTRIRVNGKRRELGYFRTAEEAAKAYDIEALKVYGEFANLNFPKEIYG